MEIIDYVVSALEGSFPTVSWMDTQTIKIAVDKVQAMKKKIAYPDWVMDPVQVDKYYNTVCIHPTDNSKQL